MINKLLSLVAIGFYNALIFGQTYTVYQNDFESPGSSWINSFSTGPNEWLWNDCAGNGPTNPGVRSHYISAGGTTEDCAPTGKYRYAYENSIGLIGGAISQIEIDATCTSSMQMTFDYKTEGVPLEDYVELVYSTDGGASYSPIGLPLAISPNWTTQTVSLPALLNNTIYRIGFRFVYNNSTVNGNPPAFDNILITGSDVTAPSITICPPNTNYALNSLCNISIGDHTQEVIASDNCTPSLNLIISQSPAAGTFIFTQPGQTELVFITVKDNADNITQCSFTATAIDNTNPVVTCPVLSDVNFNAFCEATVPDISGLVSWSDNCYTDPADMTFSQTPNAGTTIYGTQAITFTVTDPSGNTTDCSSTLTVIDNTAPILVCPPNETIAVNANCTINLNDYTTLVTVTDNCLNANPVILNQIPAEETLLTVSTIVTILGEDEAGNIGNCTFTVTPIDVTNPSVTCPSNSTVAAGTSCLYTIGDLSTFLAINDNCTAVFNMDIIQSPASGEILSPGDHTINFIIEDEAGNTNSCNYTLTVEDQTAPSIICPGNIDLIVNTNCEVNIGDYTSLITVTDNCSSLGSIIVNQSPAANTVIDENTQIIITSIDEEGNTSDCNFFAILIDDIDPILTCPNELDIAINSSCQYLVPDLATSVIGTDNCSEFLNMTFAQNPIAGATEGGLTAVFLTLTDEQGNQGTCITLLIPEDSEAPTVTCPNPPTVNNGTNCDFILPNYGAGTLVLDNCSDFTITQSPPFGSTVQAGATLIEIEVNDVAGNMVSCSFTLNVYESVSPSITCPSNISTCDPVVNYTEPTIADNCEAILSQIDATGLSSGSTFPVGITVLEYEVEDPSGNSLTCSFNVQVLDYPAEATIIPDTIGLCNATSTVVSAETHTTGTGEWSIFAGQGNFNNQFTNTTGVNNLIYGTNILVYEITTVSCGSTSDTLYVIASQQPLPASTQDTMNACNSSQINLLSNTPLYGIGIWTTSDETAVIEDENSSTTTATNLSSGWNEYIWTITNGSCPSTSDTMHVYIAASAQIYQSDTNFCIESGSIELTASAPETGQDAYWIFTVGNGYFDDATSNNTSVSDLTIGLNKLVYVLEHPACASTSDTITIVASLCEEFDPIFPTVITPNLDGKNDLFVISYLEKVYPECSVVIFNRWGSIVYESVGYEAPWDGTHNGEPLPMGTYFYKIELNDPDNTVYNGPISIIR